MNLFKIYRFRLSSINQKNYGAYAVSCMFKSCLSRHPTTNCLGTSRWLRAVKFGVQPYLTLTKRFVKKNKLGKGPPKKIKFIPPWKFSFFLLLFSLIYSNRLIIDTNFKNKFTPKKKTQHPKNV